MKRKCSVCGKVSETGYLWDNTTFFCSDTCGAKALDNDMGCFDILIDDGRIKPVK